MEIALGHLDDSQLLAVIDAAMDALTDDRLRLPDDAQLMALGKAGLRVQGRLSGWLQRLMGRIDSGDVTWRAHGTSTTTWLAEAHQFTGREAGRLIDAGQQLDRFPIVGDACAAGAVLPAQAAAITGVLDKLPDDLDADTVQQAQELMVGFAADHTSNELRKLSGHLFQLLAPDTAEQLEAARLQRELHQAERDRFLEFRTTGHGSILIRGSLPLADAQPLVAIVDAYAAAHKRALEAADPLTERTTPGRRRADALLAMVHQHQQTALAPGHGGDRPRIVITLSYDKLLKQAHDHHLLDRCMGEGREPSTGGNTTSGGRQVTRTKGSNGRPADGTSTAIGVPATGTMPTGEPIPASVLRRLLCDADILPAVLSGPTEILDVGRSQRLVTPPIRAALELRDGGCVFPGCDKPPTSCHAHHIVPWWAGGDTALPNLALLCPHHHGIIEPSHNPTDDRWQLRLRPDGLPEIRPPRRVDPNQKPRLHARFKTPRRE